jgi:hypothetical protein
VEGGGIDRKGEGVVVVSTLFFFLLLTLFLQVDFAEDQGKR